MHTKRKMSHWKAVALLFAAAFLARSLLAMATARYPIVGLDEFLYYNTGRSIGISGKLLYHGQPADYSYVLYPLIISPVYALFPDGCNFYRLIQIWNILLMSTSAFPLYALARRMLGDDRKALWATALGMLLPDFFLGQIICSESILYPLFFTVAALAYRHIETGDRRCLPVIGALGGLMYSAKPGAMVAPLLFLVLALAGGLAKKDGKKALAAVGGLLAGACVSGVFWCLARYAFGYDGGLFSIYNTQIAVAAEHHLGVFFKAVATYPLYFILACGILGFVYPFLMRKGWTEQQRRFYWFALASLGALIVGTSWLINRTEFYRAELHLRYLAMFIPLVLLFCFLPAGTVSSGKNGKPQAGILAQLGALAGYVLLATFIFGCKVGAQTVSKYPMPSLAILTDQGVPMASQMVGNLVIAAACLAACWAVWRCFGKKSLRTLAICSMAACMLLNGTVTYVFSMEDTRATQAQDAREALSLTDGHDFIYVSSETGVADGGIDVNTRRNLDSVFLNDLFNHLVDENGCYAPFVPEATRGFVPVNPTADVDTLILDNTCAPFLQLNPEAAASVTTQNLFFTVVQFTPGERLVDSCIGNIHNWVLTEGTNGILVIYNMEMLKQPLRIRFDITSEVGQTMNIFCTSKLETIELSPGRAWYEVTFDSPEDAFNFNVEDAHIILHQYELLGPEDEA